MKFSPLLKLGVVASTVAGTVIVVTSKPSSQEQGFVWPTHTMMPNRISMNRMQEFKDIATIHLNDAQNSLTNGAMKPKKGTYVIAKTVMRDFFVEKVVILSDSLAAGSASGGTMDPLTPAQVAVLTYAFDEGVDIMMKNGMASKVSLEAGQTGIKGKVTPQDLGMSDGQFRAMVMRYVDAHPMRFWNEARAGLASGR